MFNEDLRDDCSRLMPLIAAGDRDALAHLYDATAPTVLALLRHRGATPDRIEALVTSVYTHVWTNANRRPPTRDPLAWILTLTLQHARSQAPTTTPQLPRPAVPA